MPHRLIWLALALPLLVILLAIARAELFLHQASEFSLAIGGYDPRDLLQGRYLQFRLLLDTDHTEEREACDTTKQACCWCLSHVHDAPAAIAERATCHTARELCDGSLPLEAASKAFRFYVPEAQASAMERALAEARSAETAFAVFAIDQDGEARVRELRLNGRKYVSLPSAPEL
jgi:uncharacterized membrane-anchored protein